MKLRMPEQVKLKLQAIANNLIMVASCLYFMLTKRKNKWLTCIAKLLQVVISPFINKFMFLWGFFFFSETTLHT